MWGDVVQMQAGCRHTVLADSELQLIEVQLGKEISVHDKQKFPLEQEMGMAHRKVCWRCGTVN